MHAYYNLNNTLMGFVSRDEGGWNGTILLWWEFGSE
jgi:hypothetical protein